MPDSRGGVRKSPAIAIHTLQFDDEWRRGLPVLSGSVVELREVGFEDVPSLHVLIASDPKVTAYISPPPPTIRALQGFVAWAHQQREAGKLVCYAIVPKGLHYAVGIIQVRKIQPNFFVGEWGFVLGAAFWGTGVFEDAAILVANFAFDTVGVHRLEARAVTSNARGNGALQKIGAQGEAILRAGLKRDNVLLTQYLWSLRSVDWQARRSAVRTRFDPGRVENQIQQALIETRRAIAREVPLPPGRHEIPLHPFFISDERESDD